MESIKLAGDREISSADETAPAARHRPVSIVFERVSANWSCTQLPPTLCNVSMKIQGGELCALVGPVGSGKSSTLHLILRELPVGAGYLKLRCKPFDDTPHNKQGYAMDAPDIRISYASQEAWLFSGTVRENILFGQPYDKKRYIAVNKAIFLFVSKDRGGFLGLIPFRLF